MVQVDGEAQVPFISLLDCVPFLGWLWTFSEAGMGE